MYKKILTAINEHINSEITARYALNLARACNAKLLLCFIAERDLPISVIEKAQDAIKRIFIEADKQGISVECITETGNVVKEIERIVKLEKVSIVFASTRREDVEKRFYAGTVARNLSIRLPCSVALVRIVHMGRIHPKNILVPLKAKIDHIRERAYFIAKLSQAFHSRVSILNVTKPITRFFHGEIHLTPAQWEKRLPKNIKDFMEIFKGYEIAHEGRLTPGIPSRSITIEAAAKRHDLIIMGASERGLLSSFIKGNPVEDVLRETTCDLIILKPRHED